MRLARCVFCDKTLILAVIPEPDKIIKILRLYPQFSLDHCSPARTCVPQVLKIDNVDLCNMRDADTYNGSEPS